MITWTNQKRFVSDLIPAKYNPRKLSDKDKADLTNSLDKFSLVDPIIINQNNVVIGGHMRLRILLEKNISEVDVLVPDRLLDEREERELNLRLNKNTGAWDESILASFDAVLLADVGFDAAYIDSLLKMETSEDDVDVEAEVAAIVTPVTRRGDIIILGDHRLMCGDSSDFADVEKLMDGSLADLIYTDPPYNVNYKSQSKEDFDLIQNDNKEEVDFVAWLSEVFRNGFAVSREHVNVYSWFAMSNYSLFRQAIEAAGFRYMQVIMWVKERFVLSRGWYYHIATEPCMIAYRDWNKKYSNNQYAKEDDVWDLDRLSFEERLDMWFQRRDDNKDYVHPTQKPVRLGERALKKNSEPGHVVLDLFGGSGSTLICCEQLKRRAFLMELDPRYCDAIVVRWEKFTGKQATRVGYNVNMENV